MCCASQTTLAEAEAHTIAFLANWIDRNQSPMCGNSICQDRRFLARRMPQLERYFHYRNIDVSTLKELHAAVAKLLDGFSKAGTHTALSDIRNR